MICSQLNTAQFLIKYYFLIRPSQANNNIKENINNFNANLLPAVNLRLHFKYSLVASFPGSTAQLFLHFGKTRVGSLGSLVRHTTSRIYEITAFLCSMKKILYHVTIVKYTNTIYTTCSLYIVQGRKGWIRSYPK